MHLIETYATNSGLKINKPDLYMKYFPLPFKRYVVFHPHSKPIKTYDHWSEVLDLVIPYFQKNGIHVVQIGAEKEEQYQNVYYIAGKTSIPQVNYLIYNSLLLFGVDSFSCHIASVYDKKIVSLYSNNNINNVKPYWSNPKDVSLLEPKREGTKPYYALNGPKEVNTIPPETIAAAILDKLGITNYNFPYVTKYLGNSFRSKVLEIVPNMVSHPDAFNASQIVVRMDLEFNERCLDEQLKFGRAVVVTDKPIDIQLIEKHRLNIVQLIYKLNESYNPNFAKNLIKTGINHAFITFETGDLLRRIKFDFMEIGPVHIKERFPVKNVTQSKLNFYKNGKCILSNSNVYPSVYAWRRNLPMKGIGIDIFSLDVDTTDFDEELDHYIIYSLA